MIRVHFPNGPLGRKILLGDKVFTEPLDRCYEVEFRDDCVARAFAEIRLARCNNIEPKAVVCGFTAYVSIASYVACHGNSCDAERAVLWLEVWDDPVIDGLPVLYNSSLGCDSDVFVVAGGLRAIRKLIAEAEACGREAEHHGFIADCEDRTARAIAQTVAHGAPRRMRFNRDSCLMVWPFRMRSRDLE